MTTSLHRVARRWAAGALLGVLALMARPALSGPANYYKYVDSDGRLHITNRPEGARWKLYKSLPGSGGGRTPVAIGTRSRRVLDSEALRRYDTAIRGASRRYHLPEALVRAVIHTESAFNSRAVSRMGAMGLMQLMPSTARHLGVRDPFDPHQNIYGGTRFLRMLANRYNGELNLVLAAYNAGAANVQRYGGVPPFAETRAYVRSVMQRFYAYEQHARLLGGANRRPGPKRDLER